MEQQITDLKKAAIDFLTLASSGKIHEAYSQYVDENFIQHNGHFKGDRQSLMQAMEENYVQNPNKVITVKHALSDGDLVAIHSHVKLDPQETGMALVHIFRFKGSRIVELWDLGEPVPAEAVNENGMF